MNIEIESRGLPTLLTQVRDGRVAGCRLEVVAETTLARPRLRSPAAQEREDQFLHDFLGGNRIAEDSGDILADRVSIAKQKLLGILQRCHVRGELVESNSGQRFGFGRGHRDSTSLKGSPESPRCARSCPCGR